MKHNNIIRKVMFLESMLVFLASVLPEPDGLVQNYIMFFINFYCGALHLEKL